jgi:hypothetical protein
MKRIIEVFVTCVLLEITSAVAATYTYSTAVTGPIDFTGYVTLGYNTGVVTEAAPVTIFANAPLDPGAIYQMLGGTVTPTSITQTGFELQYPPHPQYGLNDSQVFSELLHATWTIVPVPEPGSFGLLGAAGILGIVMRHRSRFRA